MAKSLYGKVLSKIEDAINSSKPYPEALAAEEGNRILSEGLRGGKPFFAGRLGTTETNNLSWYVKFNRPLGLPFAKDLLSGSWQAAGLFPPRSSTLRRWSQLCEEALSLTDLYCSWNLSMDAYYRLKDLRQATFVDLGTLDAFRFAEPWTWALAGKKVLVVHPFADTIQEQYRTKRTLLFGQRPVLPEMTLSVVRAPQTIAGNTGGYRSWVEAFEATKQKIDAVDFDVALVAAGSYGMPLSAYIRKGGKQVVYVGGVLQILFGIRGSRWDQLGLYNEHWVSPALGDRPQNFLNVENGCYW